MEAFDNVALEEEKLKRQGAINRKETEEKLASEEKERNDTREKLNTGTLAPISEGMTFCH
jgi:hypothetical protein